MRYLFTLSQSGLEGKDSVGSESCTRDCRFDVVAIAALLPADRELAESNYNRIDDGETSYSH
jgi:hypothetical protein